MPPMVFLTLLLALTTVAAIVEVVASRRRRKRLHRMATQWEMHYAPGDLLHLAGKVAENFPIPGAANLRITDLIYGLDKNSYRYVFTAQYTLGILRTKKRHRRAASWTEPRERGPAHEPSSVILAPEELDLLEQYQHLAPHEFSGHA